MTIIQRATKSVTTLRRVLVAAVAAAALAMPSQAVAGPAPLDPPPASASAHMPASGGRTDQQFWGQATWLNALSGLNLDRSAASVR
jgi:hypothetical protein